MSGSPWNFCSSPLDVGSLKAVCFFFTIRLPPVLPTPFFLPNQSSRSLAPRASLFFASHVLTVRGFCSESNSAHQATEQTQPFFITLSSRTTSVIQPFPCSASLFFLTQYFPSSFFNPFLFFIRFCVDYPASISALCGVASPSFLISFVIAAPLVFDLYQTFFAGTSVFLYSPQLSFRKFGRRPSSHVPSLCSSPGFVRKGFRFSTSPLVGPLQIWFLLHVHPSPNVLLRLALTVSTKIIRHLCPKALKTNFLFIVHCALALLFDSFSSS